MLNVTHPVVVAPMGGGPSTPTLVVASARAGALAFLAGAYKPADRVAAEIAEVRAATSLPFGVNLFVPGAPTRDTEGLDRHLRALQAEADAVGVALGDASWDDDGWDAKIEVVTDAAPAVVSFTFGVPPAPVVEALHRRGADVVVTVTSAAEATAAADCGADAVCAQGVEAGAHRGSFADEAAPTGGLATLDLVASVRGATRLPILAAGGIAGPDDVAAALAAGATAVQAGTAFLRCDESGAHPVHQAALVDARFTRTAFTRSFSGRHARGLVNRFVLTYGGAPWAYPEINNATRPLRAAAASRGDPHGMSLWAGTGHASARAGPARDIVEWLASGAR